ncbi:MAG: imidazoleglycerol-phosphate dehydratase [Crenarchaeota archaeon]|nr:imidazoleglycerol-phosphate dehydratase [Thermoproteota archaeon]
MRLTRETRETRVELVLEIGSGEPYARVETGIGFLDHMVETLAFYAGWRLEAKVIEVRHVDDHHVAEDLMLTLGAAVRRWLESVGWRVARFGWSMVPMDEALVMAAVDLSGRPGAWVSLRFTREEIGGLALENIGHMIQSFAAASLSTIHVRQVAGRNDHHIAEAAFKALGFALRQALQPSAKLVSTKGALAPEHGRGGLG